ncbi:unnamed protein product [Anisakis simplex]|uniref:Peptidase A1 domain-containing protein n=1 Tax=Anisakis simplex TaxID=6269 RepID=A0A3P6NJZ0_ANISI|nr:unnamed protein product [Anisakis simplex]
MIPHQSFGVAERIGRTFSLQPIDGIFGMAWPKIASDNIEPPLQRILRKFGEPMFTVWMSRSADIALGGVGGVVTYGGFDSVHCSANISWVNLTAQTFWQFSIQGYSLGNVSSAVEQQAISDTGTSWIGGPRKDIDRMLTALNASFSSRFHVHTLDCSRRFDAPDLVFKIDSQLYAIPSYEYILNARLEDDRCMVTLFVKDDFDDDVPRWTFGDTFIRTYCNVYDFGGSRIGFSKAKHNNDVVHRKYS